ncbi:unnamed protein product [Leuciscus chuanchicus]
MSHLFSPSAEGGFSWTSVIPISSASVWRTASPNAFWLARHSSEITEQNANVSPILSPDIGYVHDVQQSLAKVCCKTEESFKYLSLPPSFFLSLICASSPAVCVCQNPPMIELDLFKLGECVTHTLRDRLSHSPPQIRPELPAVLNEQHCGEERRRVPGLVSRSPRSPQASIEEPQITREDFICVKLDWRDPTVALSRETCSLQGQRVPPRSPDLDSKFQAGLTQCRLSPSDFTHDRNISMTPSAG